MHSVGESVPEQIPAEVCDCVKPDYRQGRPIVPNERQDRDGDRENGDTEQRLPLELCSLHCRKVYGDELRASTSAETTNAPSFHQGRCRWMLPIGERRGPAALRI